MTGVEGPTDDRLLQNSSSSTDTAHTNGDSASGLNGSSSHSAVNVKRETNEDSDDDIPLLQRAKKMQNPVHNDKVIKEEVNSKVEKDRRSSGEDRKRAAPESDSEDDMPLSKRLSHSTDKKPKKRKGSDDDEDFEPVSKKKKKDKHHNKDHHHHHHKGKKDKHSDKKPKSEVSDSGTPKKGRKKQEEEHEVWEWWKEEKREDGVKWTVLEHRGPLFAPPYERLPSNVKFSYNGKEMKLSENTEEVATFYAKMLDHDYTTKEQFNKNFFKDWRKVMTPEEREKITDLRMCDFRKMNQYFLEKTEERKNRSKDEKNAEKEANAKIQKEYGIAIVDGYKQKIGNYRIEPPGLFRGRGDHPKMGKLKKRVQPESVTINCSKKSKVPDPPPGHRWKEVRHDNTVTWLVSWTENVLGSNKYVMLNPSSKIKGEKDWQKFETARGLKDHVDRIRRIYKEQFKSKEMRIRQRAVALYFIDILALRAGNEKEEGETSDTVGCCSLRCEHINLLEEKSAAGDPKYMVEFDFLGKDSIRYYNKVAVDKRVFKNLKIFKENKSGSDDLFDRLNTSILNKYLQDQMEGLTAKVFRTYNASITLQEQLDILTNYKDSVVDKILSYNRANREVAILCNHQRAVPKTHAKTMENLDIKIKEKKNELKDAKKELEKSRSQKDEEKAQKKVARIKEQLKKLKVQRTDKDENKDIALGTSKLNYLDPRISVAWCKKNGVPLEKVYSKTHREKFRWAIDMATEDYIF